MSVSPLVERQLGFFTEEEQIRLGESTVVVAGAGGDGGELAVSLARMGVGAEGGEIRLADPDTFEVENINRQACCTTETVGMNKAEVVAAHIKKINPAIRVVVFTDGITRENVAEFVDGASLLIDETEFTLHAIGVSLAREARRNHIPNLQVMNVGFGAQVSSYDAEGKFTMEKRLGLREDMSLDEVEKADVSILRWLAELPSDYGDMHVFERVAKGEKSAPSVVTGVSMAAGVASAQAVLHLVGQGNKRQKPIMAPHVLSMDAMTGEGHVIKYPRVHIMTSLLKMALRNKLGMNPRADY